MFDNDAWLNKTLAEEVIDPTRVIVDPHHHIWENPKFAYNLDTLLEDVQSGHRIVKTIFVECGASYRKDGPDHLKSVGETEFVVQAAERFAERSRGATIAGMVAHADLAGPHLSEALDAHLSAGQDLVKGIRHSGAHAQNPSALLIPGRAPAGLFAMDTFRRGVSDLSARGLTFDTWIYSDQLSEFRDLAVAVPETIMILDHFGTPLASHLMQAHPDDLFERWKDEIAAVAECQNVFAKLGGLAMPDIGYAWHKLPQPPSSDRFIASHGKWYEHTIKCFGPQRCMFESNFPVDRLSISYRSLWNAFKKIATKYSETERNAMFNGVASSVYRL